MNCLTSSELAICILHGTGGTRNGDDVAALNLLDNTAVDSFQNAFQDYLFLLVSDILIGISHPKYVVSSEMGSRFR